MTDSGMLALANVSTLEGLIALGPAALPDTKACLFGVLCEQAKITDADDLVDVISLAAGTATNPNVSALVMRALAVPNLLPEPTQENQLRRHIVALSERLTPSFLQFLRVSPTAQTFEKFVALEGLHERVVDILSPLTDTSRDLPALLSSKNSILSALNHSVVKVYCAPFHIKTVKPCCEMLLSALSQVHALDETLLADIERANEALTSTKTDLKALDSFLTRAVRGNFVDACQQALTEFLSYQRGRFTAAIVTTSSVNALARRYPLSETGRELTVSLPLKNSGQGTATNVQVVVATGNSGIALNSDRANLGNVSPGPFSVSIPILVASPTASFDLFIEVSWGELLSAERKTSTFDIQVLGQRNDIAWDDWEYRNPYSTQVAEGNEFVGRTRQVRRLSAKFISQPMESFYITGQKRVGKTSLALAAVAEAQSNDRAGSLEAIYVLWGNVAHANPETALRRLGQAIDRAIRKSFPFESVGAPELYEGSLSSLVDLLDQASEVVPSTRYVITIDEFDEIPSELFMQGNLADTFFANLRGISRCRNASLVLVGGENMPFVMDRQGQKLNNFARFDLSYFSRDTEYDDYSQVVRAPTSDLLTWQDDAISELFNLTNGNPYFTKLICASILTQALAERDADITSVEVGNAASRNLASLGSNSFSHLWQDGIPKRPDEREPDVNRRLRVLAAIARCGRRGVAATRANVLSNRTTPSMTESDLLPVLNDFVSRKVLTDNEEFGYRFVLPVFEMWLADIGLSQLISNVIGDDLASEALSRENAAAVTASEVSELSRTWPTYRGRLVGSEDIRSWLQQVESVFDQRILFNFLSRTKVVGEPFIRERLATAHSIVRRSVTLPEFVVRKRGEQRKDLVITFVDGEGKSGSLYASMYAEENKIPSTSIIPPSNFSDAIADYSVTNGEVKLVVIVDDVVATGNSLSENLKKFVKKNMTQLRDKAVRIVSLFSTSIGDATIQRCLNEIDLPDVEYRSCEVLPERSYAFPTSPGVWSSPDEEARARSLARDLGATIYSDHPLGFGDLGLLLVLPTTVPNNTLPILHTASRPSAGHSWTPIFPRIVN